MTFTLTYAWWWIPALVTVVSVSIALFKDNGKGGYLQGIDVLFNIVPALAITALSWVIGGIFK